MRPGQLRKIPFAGNRVPFFDNLLTIRRGRCPKRSVSVPGLRAKSSFPTSFSATGGSTSRLPFLRALLIADLACFPGANATVQMPRAIATYNWLCNLVQLECNKPASFSRETHLSGLFLSHLHTLSHTFTHFHSRSYFSQPHSRLLLTKIAAAAVGEV